jgi:hypothetical protein
MVGATLVGLSAVALIGALMSDETIMPTGAVTNGGSSWVESPS